MASVSNIINLFRKSGDPIHNSMGDMLDAAQDKATAGHYGKNVGALLVVWDRDTSDSYRTFYESSGMTASQVIALLEVIKHRIMNERMKEPV